MNITIKKNQASSRIDQFLVTKKDFLKCSRYSRNDFRKAIKNEIILVNDCPIKPSYLLKELDIINIKNITRLLKNNNLAILEPNKDIELNIVFKNKDIIVINKPAGLIVHPSHLEKKETLANSLISKFPELKNVGDDIFRPGIVHRLDKDTSGIIVVARQQKVFLELKKLFKNKKVQKKYLALVYGNPLPENSVINKSLARASNYKKQVIAGQKTKTKIRNALTKYETLKKFTDYSLLAVYPKTGRTHQIRVHLLSIGHPIIGDKIYKLKKYKKLSNKFNQETTRQLLHAEEINFKLFNKKYHFVVPPPNDFVSFIQSATLNS